MPTCLLVRHGRTTANAAGTLAGWTPGIELDDEGRRAAEALAARLTTLPIVAVVASPLTRCLQTADLLRAGAAPGVPVEEHEGLGECRYGAWTGRPLSELAKEPLWRVVQEHPSAATFPDGPTHPGESLAGMSARAVAAIREVDARVLQAHGPDALWAAVSHGDVIKAILADALGLHLDQFQRLVVAPASLSVVRYTDRRAFVLRTGDTGADLSTLRPTPAGAGAATGDGSGDAAVGGGA